MKLELETLRHVAELAALSLSPEEEASLGEDIGRVLTYMEELDAVDTSSVDATSHLVDVVPARAGDGWRDDEPVPSLASAAVLGGAPRVEDGGFAVPGFVE